MRFFQAVHAVVKSAAPTMGNAGSEVPAASETEKKPEEDMRNLSLESLSFAQSGFPAE
ncbi:MAG: hypothetical protein QMC36_05295 [Patescibacteria group bacterium]